MWEIARDIPDVNLLLAMSRQQLGAKLLLAARARFGAKEFSPHNLNLEMWPQSSIPGQQTPYPRERRSEVERAFSEAWTWLQNKEWIVPYPSAGATYVPISREAEHVSNEAEIIGEAAARETLKGSDVIEQIGKTSPAPAKRHSQRVFIVHGHDDGAREAIARFLERVGFEPIILHEQANRGRTIIEKFEAHRDVGFAVVLLTPDDEGCENGGTPRPRARQNVVLELGYFLGALGRDHVCALRRGDVEIPSDLMGVVYVPYDNSEGWKQALGKELEAAGLAVDWKKAMGSQR